MIQCKMKVTPKESEKVQQICFNNGIYWGTKGNEISNLDKPYLFIERMNKNLTILTYASDREVFDSDPLTEITPEDFIDTYGD